MPSGTISARKVLRAMLLPPPLFAAEAERDFLYDYSRRHVLQRRIAVAISVFTSLSFLPWDLIHYAGQPDFPLSLAAIIGLRLTNFIALLIAFFVSLHARFESEERFATLVLIVVTLVCYVSFSATTYLVGYPLSLLYGVASYLSVVFSYSVLRLRARTIIVLMTAALLMSAVGYGAAVPDPASAIEHAHRVHGVVLFHLLFSFCVLGIFVGNMGERAERSRFLRERELASTSEDLKRRHADIKQLNEQLSAASRAKELKAAALLRAKEEMRQAAETRSRETSMFLASAVHDLKQPLQAIGNALEPALMAAARDDRRGMLEMLDLTRAAAKLMREQLGAILELSHLQSAHLQPTLITLDLEHMLLSQVEQFAGLANRDGVSLRLECGEGAPFLTQSDAHFLQRIIGNLVTNGIKYRRSGAEGGCRVDVRLRREPNRLSVMVEDNGTGIPEDAVSQGRIFQPFFQASNNQLREARRGVGLGLSIVKNMLDLLPGHHIEVESRVGAGSRFTLYMPISASPQPAARIDPSPQLAPHMLALLENCYVLLVEDDEFVLRATMQLLDSQGILCETYESYESCAAAMDRLERVPDCIVSDFRLPNGHTALDVARRARACLDDIPTVVFTGENIDLNDPSMRAFSAVLRKPVSAEALLAAIAVSLPERSRNTSFGTAP